MALQVSPPESTPARLRADAVGLARASVLGMSLFTAAVIALHPIEPEFDPISRTVSEYVLGDAGWLLTLAGLAFGLGVLALAVALAACLPSPRPRAGLGLLATAGVAMLVVSAFPGDPVTHTGPVELTTSGWVHFVAGMVAFVGLAVAAPLLTRRLAAPGQPLAALLRGLAVAAPVGLAIFAATTTLGESLGGLFGRLSAHGLGERIMVAAFVAWVVTAALSLSRANRGEPKVLTRQDPSPVR